MSLSVDIQKRLGQFQLQVHFENEGGTLGLLGASGCGKSTTLQCIAGIMKPDAGRIVLNDRVLFDSEQRINLSPQKRQIGYLFQQYALFPNMTVEQNIYAGVRGGTRAEKKKKVDYALTAYHLKEVRKQRPATLSGGQQQRTALARMLVGEPELLLLDEPFSALDENLREQLMWELSRSLQQFGGDVLFVSHNRTEVRRFCGNVCVLDKGISEPVQTTGEMLFAPKTVPDARLAGYFNIAGIERLKPKEIFVPKWGAVFPDSREDPLLEAVCVPEDALIRTEKEAPGSFPCVVSEQIERESGDALLLHPLRGDSETLLMMDGNVRDLHTNDVIWISVTENRLLYLAKNAI